MPTANDTNIFGLIFLVVILLGFGVFLGVFLGREWTERKQRKQAAEAAQRSRLPQMSDEDRVMFGLHRRINQSTITKMEMEVAILQSQVKAHADDDQRLRDAKAFHELSVEKARLEIDSLRLQIAEQRKRLDEFGLGGG